MLMPDTNRIPIGVWIESPKGAQWANQGMTRLLGFIVEGIAIRDDYVFRITVTDDIRDEAEEDFADLNATKGIDYTFHSPRDANQTAQSFDELAHFANRHVHVTCWLSLFPNQISLRLLTAPVCTIFPDAIGLAYHDFSDGAWVEQAPPVQWRDRVRRTLKACSGVITFSDHVARDQVMAIFGEDKTRIKVIPHAPPSLDGILPFAQGGIRTPETRFRAAQRLRDHAARVGDCYLIDFPFEHVRFAAISTQDRVTKNIKIAVNAVDWIVRELHDDFKVITTAQLHYGTHWTPTLQTIASAQLHFDVLSMPDLPRDVHASLYHCAELVVHTSVFEGGRGVFPFYEAISVGTPCLMADGPHVAELLEQAPEMGKFVFDPHDAIGLAALMLSCSAERDRVTSAQAATYANLACRTWDEVAREYAEAALAGIASQNAT
jgi:glycosyltransferase involved in cell wall biosynthesis